jgi:hypothetical protein
MSPYYASLNKRRFTDAVVLGIARLRDCPFLDASGPAGAHLDFEAECGCCDWRETDFVILIAINTEWAGCLDGFPWFAVLVE